MFALWQLKLATAGLWDFIWHWGVGIGAIILLLVGAVFTTSVPIIGPFLGDLRKDLLWAAAAIALVLGGQWIGAHDAANRCHAQQTVIEKLVTKTVDRAKTQTGDPWDSSK